ncbi:MAG TPA: ABC transporter permease [Euryarchaeota archaeon]|nr:ABC transporter permease [Euryarchaeota archaeon]
MSADITELPLTLRGRLKMALAPRIRELRFSLHLLSKSASSIAGLVLLIFFLILALFPSLFAPARGVDPYVIPFDATHPFPEPPGSEGFPLGSGPYGYDIYYGIIWGARLSMVFAIVVVGISVLIGTILGLIAGYRGGVIDELIMRITDVFLSIPFLILVIAIAAVLGRGLDSSLKAMIVVFWSGYTRIIRGQVLAVRENAYVDAARAAGSGELRIMFRHILPNSWAPSIVQATMDMGTVVLVLAALSYLGLGAEPGTAEWGAMVQEGADWMVAGKWWMVFFPGLVISLFVLGFNLLGDGMRDILDPKMRR